MCLSDVRRGNSCRLKDHKLDFSRKPTVRLFHPSKSDIGRISKKILDRIIPGLRNYIRLEQWQNTDRVIEWFREIENKKNTKFIQIDITSYYPSISQILLNKALIFAMYKSDLERSEIDTILTARRTVVGYDDTLWNRKNRLTLFR